ncbi:hypothetical protein BKA70DRAFT_1435630 [Coprinopsis sp. MPI-PUGE-AT-0042]|nr:hypothetical protein BKA70DRAFT_1435630 [Coprinopsis sp. MPI-PUGE-AT-0042]
MKSSRATSPSLDILLHHPILCLQHSHHILSRTAASSHIHKGLYIHKVSSDTFENPQVSMFLSTLQVQHAILRWALETLVQDGHEVVVFRGVDVNNMENDHNIYPTRRVRESTQTKLSSILGYIPGKIADAIKRLITLYRPDSLVVGMRGRKGLLATFAGIICFKGLDLNSKLVADSRANTPLIGDRCPGSSLSTVPISGVIKEERDTPRLRVRHREMHSENEDAPSPSLDACPHSTYHAAHQLPFSFPLPHVLPIYCQDRTAVERRMRIVDLVLVGHQWKATRVPQGHGWLVTSTSSSLQSAYGVAREEVYA